ncbi:hypothetical protein D9M69_735240 [compost metagenome]
MNRISATSHTRPAQINGLGLPNPNGRPRSLRQRKTFIICITTMAARQAVVATWYSGSSGAKVSPYCQPPFRSTKKKAASAAAASIGPRKR